MARAVNAVKDDSEAFLLKIGGEIKATLCSAFEIRLTKAFSKSPRTSLVKQRLSQRRLTVKSNIFTILHHIFSAAKRLCLKKHHFKKRQDSGCLW
jgi:hypothetical protein